MHSTSGFQSLARAARLTCRGQLRKKSQEKKNKPAAAGESGAETSAQDGVSKRTRET